MGVGVGIDLVAVVAVVVVAAVVGVVVVGGGVVVPVLGLGGVTLIQTKQKRTAREQRNKYKPRTETRTTPSNQARRQAGGLTMGSQLEL